MSETLIETPELSESEKLDFKPRPPEYKGTIDAVGWSMYNSSGKEIGISVQIGGRDGIRFKLLRRFL